MGYPKLPDSWSEWEITDELGAGAYGTVYQAENADEDTCAIKIIHIPSGNAELQAMRRDYPDDNSIRKYYAGIVDDFQREIDAMRQLKGHPNIVQIGSYFVDADEEHFSWTIYIQMEYLNSLSDYRLEHAFDERKVIELGIDICEALELCRERKILHRDIKPDNIMVDDDGRFKLGDFGIARSIDKTMSTLSLRGTFTFMAPEIYHGEKYGSAADLYSLGLVLYRFLNRMRDPFVDLEKQFVLYQDKEEAIQKRMSGEAIPAPCDASEDMSEIILCALAYMPEERYQTPGHMKAALLSLLNHTYVKGCMMPEVKKEDEEEKKDEGAKPRHSRHIAVAAVIALLLLAGGTVLGIKVHYERKEAAVSSAYGQISEDSWSIKPLALSGSYSEEDLKSCVSETDDLLWDSLYTGDISAYRDLTYGFLRDEATDAEFEAANAYYTPETTNMDEMSAEREEELHTLYQEQSSENRYIHILGQSDDYYYAEVYRYYIDQLVEDTADTITGLDPARHGNLIQGNMLYIIAEDELSGQLQASPLVDGYQDAFYVDEDCIDTVDRIVSERVENSQDTDWQGLLQDYGCQNYMWLEKDFMYADCMRLLPAAYSADQEKNTVTFYLLVRNASGEEVDVNDCTIQVSDDRGDLDNLSMDQAADWTIPADESQYVTVTFSLDQGDRNITAEEYLDSDTNITMKIDWHDSLS